MTEITTLLVTKHRMALPASCRIPFPDSTIVSRASDKAFVVDLARQLGVPIPLTVRLDCAPTMGQHFDELPYPVVLKPARSRVRVESRWLSTGVSYAPDPAALQDLLYRVPPEAFPVLLQERIYGPGMGIFACFDDGQLVTMFAHSRVREKPPSGGVSVLCESVSPDPVAAEQAIELLKRLRWHGVAMVEFKRDHRDGLLRLMEINGRFWGSLQLAIDAGVDFPALTASIAMGESIIGPSSYRLGVRSRWLAGDLDSFVMTLFRSRRKLNLSPMHAGRLKTLWDFLHLWGRNLNYEIERADDLGPARLEWTRRFAGCFGTEASC